MNDPRRLEQANDNAAAFWLGQARAHGWQTHVGDALTAVRCARTPDDQHRVLITRSYAEPRLVEAELADLMTVWSTGCFTLEDPYGSLDLTGLGAVRMPVMPVMVREPGSLGRDGRALPYVWDAPGGGSLTVDEVVDGDALADAEHVVVDGFPQPARQPWKRGEAVPPRLLHDRGCRVWLGRLDGTPAGACLTYDDGRATGVYWLATLPSARGRGVARAVMETALTAVRPDRPATLVATAAGEPLYRRLGFTDQGRTCWWTRTAPADRAQP
ncbi:GNAT family N-acetyltransferase [Streptomyces sp. SP17BM10]|uniref:GNAT family N-acetyltransferase n=1 Tax=Streptomyces sp. SP17BM10 TaxID=3002530 RepID=UPI002E77B259|nr:GNAT family N-acetyltransferase [Streptomyces sp. SP17BM10]MEE1785844.1 GNAT family N-acetyltransferase [Streptomyces sp. SP17BM10]